MKKLFFISIFILVFVFLTIFSFAEVSTVNVITNSDEYTARAAVVENSEPRLNHTSREEAEGKIISEKLQAKQIQCLDLSDKDFGTLGEYFMGRMMGNSHETMNNMMIQMMDEKGEEQMHIVMGKRLSGCDTSAVFPPQGIGFMPMMTMMGGLSAPQSLDRGGSSPLSINNKFLLMMYGLGNNMMSWGGIGLTFGIIGLILMVLWWLFVVAAIVFLVKWIVKQFRSGDTTQKSALDILKERYAKGEIDKKEFEEKKKGLV